MWDDSSDGLYLYPEKERVDFSKQFAEWHTDDLLKHVKAYENWMSNGSVWDFNAVFRGYRHSAFSENMKELRENLQKYDTMCREIAKRALKSGL